MTRYKVKTKLVKALGFRSKFEIILNQQLCNSGLRFAHEGPLNTVRYKIPTTNHRYLCDFLLQNGIMIEAKGYFTAKDRKKHLLIREQYPILDVRFIFSNANNRLSKKSKITYSAWCDKHNIMWASKRIPTEWLEEIKPKDELTEIKELLKRMNNE